MTTRKISTALLDQVMATAYQLYQRGRHAEAEALCGQLIAADRWYWWSYALRAAALRQLGRLEEALQQIERGLLFEPAETKLLRLRGEILRRRGCGR